MTKLCKRKLGFIVESMVLEDKEKIIQQLDETISTGLESVKDGDREIKIRSLDELVKTRRLFLGKKKTQLITPSYSRGYHQESEDE